MCFGDANDACSVWNETRRKARKMYKCEECSGRIDPGTPYVRIGSLYDGEWSTSILCTGCRYEWDRFIEHDHDAHKCGSLILIGGLSEAIEGHNDENMGVCVWRDGAPYSAPPEAKP